MITQTTDVAPIARPRNCFDSYPDTVATVARLEVTTGRTTTYKRGWDYEAVADRVRGAIWHLRRVQN